MSDRFTFLTQAINVVQSTIRAIDVKIGFLFVLVFLPSTQAKAFKAYVQASSNAMGREYMLLLIMAAAWKLSICMFLCRLEQSLTFQKSEWSQVLWVYRSTAFYEISFQDLFRNSRVRPERTVDRLDGEIPDDKKMLESGMIYELLKVSYVRGIKAARFFACLRFTMFWVVGALLLIAVYVWRAL